MRLVSLKNAVDRKKWGFENENVIIFLEYN